MRGVPGGDCCASHPSLDLVCFGMIMNEELPQSQRICGEEALELRLAAALSED